MTRVVLPAVILAGGLASRMGGGDKAFLPLGGRRIIDHIIARLAPQIGPLAVNANGDPARFGDLGLAVLADSVPGFPGPLAGVLAAMDWAAELGFDAVITVAADTPFLPHSLVCTLVDNAEPNRPCLAATGLPSGILYPQPTFGLWPVALRGRLRVDLHDGIRKVRHWAKEQNATLAPFGTDGMSFFNINTPADLLAAEAMLAMPQDHAP